MNNGWQGGRLSRRRFALALPLLGAVAWAPAGMARAAGPQRASRNLMGTRVDIVADGGDARQLQAAIGLAFDEMQRLEASLSRYREDSVVRRIGQAAGRHPVAVPPEVMDVLASAQRVWRESAGAFDPTVGALAGWHFEPGRQAMPAPAEIAAALRHVDARQLQLDERAGTAYLAGRGMALDLGGIAKLPILAAGLRVLRSHGVEHALVNGGGDVLLAGNHHGQAWRVGLRDPLAPERLLGVLALQGEAVVASSGDYERFFMARGERQHHILDPATGRPSRGAHGVSLLARQVDSVNGLGAAMMVLGDARAHALVGRHAGVEALMVHRDGTVWRTPGMAAALAAA